METIGTVIFGTLTLAPVYRPDPISITGLLLLRLFAGAFGSSALVNGPAVVEELLPGPGKAGRWGRFAYDLAQTGGFTIGPLIAIYSGWATDAGKWYRLFLIPGVGVIGVAIMSVFMLYYFHGGGETYAPLLLEEKTQRFRRDNNGQFRSRYDTNLTHWQSFQHKATAPIKLLFTDGKCAAYAVFASLMYAPQYFMFATMHHVLFKAFPSDDSTPSYVKGFHFWVFGLGVCLGHAASGLIEWVSISNPAERLALRLVPSILVIVACLLAYGWTAHFHYMGAYIILVPCLVFMGGASAFSNWCVHGAMKATFNDENGDRKPAACAASGVVLAVFGLLIPPFTLLVMDHLGPGAGSTLLMFVWLAFVFGAWVFVKGKPRVEAPAELEG